MFFLPKYFCNIEAQKITPMKIFNPICYSLYTDNVEDDQCLKRRFLAFDIVESKEIEIFVCAEYFRLLYHKHSEDNWGHSLPFKAIEEAISEYVPYWDKFNNSHEYYRSFYSFNRTNFTHLKINELLISRPKIWRSLSLSDAFEIILENPNKCRQLKSDVSNLLINWTKTETLKKDSKIVSMIRKSFNINGNARNQKYYSHDIGYSNGIDENELLDLIIYLTNKLK